MATSYLPTFRRQIGDPTTDLDSFICTLAAGAMALDYHTAGRVRKHGGELVPLCGKSPDAIRGKVAGVTAGTNLGNVETAWSRLGEVLERRRGQTWAHVERALGDGRAVILQGDYDQFSLRTRCQAKFTLDHAILLLPERTVGHTLMGDPLCATYAFAPDAELRAFAEKLGRAALGPSTPQRILFAVTRPQADVFEPTTEERPVDPKRHLPIAVADIGPATVYADADRRTVLLPAWGGAKGVGLYALPAEPGADGRAALAPIRLDLRSGAAEDLRIGWVGADVIAHVRIPGSTG